MTTMEMPDVGTLSHAYVNLLAPVPYDATRERFVQYVGEDDAFLSDFHARPDDERSSERDWDVNLDGPRPDFGPTLGRGEPFERVSALRSYWSSTEYDDRPNMFVGREGEVWECRPADPARAAIRMMVHAPGVAYTVAGDRGETVGLSTCRLPRSMARARGARSGRDLQIAVAYLCCGFLPPRGLVLAALSAGVPTGCDGWVVEGLRSSLGSIAAAVEDVRAVLA